jgi:hypothetical protein
MRLGYLNRDEAGPAQQVLPTRNRFEVIGTNTGTSPAQVVELESDRDRAMGHLVRHTMCAGDLPVECDPAIAIRLGTDPQPAAVSLSDLRPEPFG